MYDADVRAAGCEVMITTGGTVSTVMLAVAKYSSAAPGGRRQR
jgi:hypothetical protein